MNNGNSNINRGWIGVDLDGTLAKYNGWVDETHIGDPIEPMVKRIKYWLDKGVEVRIFTARVGADGKCRVPRGEVVTAIQDWAQLHIGVRLPVTNVKDFNMIQLWDDRAVGVIKNTGIPVGISEAEANDYL